ncbi:hypothetical protein N7537_001420 [Penicillium hordei]|uniref:HNH nuclease domain-containing protein n=1 Tax=Penicillium hordei TaxID=40994 RepID=A0AAD6H600_9EURO|nr:uncharacterized protein N7537_001420 [Penicillium hordei]KAJ5616306.1 hypothetical protein N7537_001420 [Penicillium hordei]
MATRNLEVPRAPGLNLRIYQDNGSLLAALEIPTDPHYRYVSAEMLYRYCSLIFLFPDENEWAIYKLRRNGTTGAALRSSSRASVGPGGYIVLDTNGNPTTVNLTTECAPRRVRTRDINSQVQGRHERDRLQKSFRDSLRNRDRCCTVTGPSTLVIEDQPFQGVDATHVFPVSMLEQWRRDGYRRYITDTRPNSEIGESGLYSAQNGLLLRADMHAYFDAFQIGIDPDADYKIILFGKDTTGMGGTRLRDSARSGTQRVSPDLLRWHLRMCLYNGLRANAEPVPIWEEDLEEDPMGSIFMQPDAAERMEVELFTRLGGLVA